MLALFSCDKKDEQAGLEIQPDENRLKIAYLDLDNFTSYTVAPAPVKTSKRNTSILLGSINDNVFGRTTASFISQYRLSSDNVKFGKNPKIISIKAYLDVVGIEGDSTLPVNYKFYESKFNIDSTGIYKSNIDLSASIGDLVADTTFVTASNSLIEIPLLKAFGQKILDADTLDLKDNDAFLKVFKGLYFTVDTNSIGDGVIWKFNFNSTQSYIELKYRNRDDTGQTTGTDDFKLQFNEKCERFNQYINNTTPLNPIFKQNKDKCYISGVGGTKAHLSLSPVLSWRDSSKIMIYKAELIVKAKPSGKISIPTKLILEIDDSNDDSLTFVDDYLTTSTGNYNGTYDSDEETYNMIITRHIQNLINNNHNDSLLWITPRADLTNPYRVILLNGADSEKIKLKITYSKLD